MTARRLASQLLAGPPADGPVEVVRRLLAVQAQDGRAARLAVRARSVDGLRVADIDRSLTDDRSLVVDWLNRGTLHLVRAEDHAWLHALTAPPQIAPTMRRLGQEGVDAALAERGVAVLATALADEGPRTADELRARLDRAGVPARGQAFAHLIRLTCLRGHALRGPMRGATQAYVLARDWVGPSPAVDREAALAELARRYLAGHAPADAGDLARWAGVPLRDARAGLAAIAGERRDEDGRISPADAGAETPPPARARLLGAFDPLLLGWASRAPVVGPYAAVVAQGGMIRAIALAGGRAVGTWTLPGGRVRLAPFAPLDPEVAAELHTDAAQVERFLGGVPAAG